MKINLMVILSVVLITFSACKDNYEMGYDRVKYLQVSPAFAVPIAFGTIKLSDLIKEKKDTVVFEKDSSISINFTKDPMFDFVAGDFVKNIKMNPFNKDVTIGNLELDPFTFSKKVTLGQMLPSLVDGVILPPSTFPLSTLIYSFEPFEQNQIKFLEATFTKGDMAFKINNNLPFDMVGVTIELFDKQLGTSVYLETGVNIPAGTSKDLPTKSLVGKTISNVLEMRISSGSLSSSTSKQVDKTNALEFSMGMSNMSVSSGKLLLGVKVKQVDIFKFPLVMSDTALKDRRLDLIKLKTGVINLKIKSEAPIAGSADVDSELGFPEITGLPQNPFGVKLQGTTQIPITIDMKGATLVYPTDDSISVKYSILNNAFNVPIIFNANQKINVIGEASDMMFSWLEGYFGYYTTTIDSGVVDLGFGDIFEKLEGGLYITNPSIRLNIKSSVGVPAYVTGKLTGESSNGKKVTVEIKKNLAWDSTGVLSDKPRKFCNCMVKDSIVFDKNTPGLIDLIALPPSKLYYSAAVTINRTKDTMKVNYLADTSRFQVGLNVKIPLTLRTDLLGYQESIKLDIDQDTKDNLKNVDVAGMYIYTKNGFPFDMSVEAFLYDSIKKVYLDTLKIDNTGNLLLKAGKTTNGKVLKGDESTNYAPITLGKSEIDNLIKANKIMIHGKINTSKDATGKAQEVTLYTYYKLFVKFGFKASGTFNLD